MRVTSCWKWIVTSSFSFCWLLQGTAAYGQVGSSIENERSMSARDSVDLLQRQQGRRRRRSASSSNVGYVDNAIVGTQLQLRYDYAQGANRPDRAEFIYGKCGCYREVAMALPPNGDPNAPGPAASLVGKDPFTTPFIETNLDYHDIVLDGEYAFHDRICIR